jgi:hypothetical protein
MTEFAATYVSSNSFTVPGNEKAFFPVDVIVRVDCGGWVYSPVESSDYSSPNTTITLSNAVLTNPCGAVEVSVCSPDGVPIHDHSNSTQGGSGIVGLPPAHEWSGTQIRFRNPDGSWGSYEEISGLEQTYIIGRAGETLAFADFVYVNNLSANWNKAEEDSFKRPVGVVTEPLGITTGYGVTGKITVHGLVTNESWNLMPGYHYYFTESGMSTTPNDYPIGWAISYTELFFLSEGGSATSDGASFSLLGTATYDLDEFDFVLLNGSGEWVKLNKDDFNVTFNVASIGIVTNPAGILHGDAGWITIGGVIINPNWTWTPGSKLYVGNTIGTISHTPGTKAICVGEALSATEIYLRQPILDIDSYSMKFTVKGQAGESLTAGKICYQKSSNGKWHLAQADGTTEEKKAKGICLTNTNSDAYCIFLIMGYCDLGISPYPIGTILYLSDTPGNVSDTPGTNEIPIGFVPVVGDEIFFSPSEAIPDIPDIPDDPGLFTISEAGDALYQYDVICFAGGALQDWRKAPMSAPDYGPPSAIVTAPGIAQGDPGEARSVGIVTNESWTWTEGSKLYLSSTVAGQITEDPTSNIVLGYALTPTSIVFIPIGPISGDPLPSGNDQDILKLDGTDPVWSSGPVVGPDYCPPDIYYKDADEIYVPAGYYNKCGPRINGRYYQNAYYSHYWQVDTDFAVDIDAVFSAVPTKSPGMIDGAKVNSSWYSVWMIGPDPEDILILPYIRVKTITYSSPSTTINPGSHNNYTVAAAGFFTSDDAFNGCYLNKIQRRGSVRDFVIDDCVNTTPDQIIVAEDMTGSVAVGDWLLMSPGSYATEGKSLYLGTIQIDSSGDLREFYKDGWVTQIRSSTSSSLNNSTSAATTDLAVNVPPVAVRIGGHVALQQDGSCKGVVAKFYRGTDTAYNLLVARNTFGTANTSIIFTTHITLPLSLVSAIHNVCVYLDPSTGADTSSMTSATLSVSYWKE